jgi:hypothetical protein
MNDNNSDERYLKLREIFNEPLLRDIVIFSMLYLFILTQNWQNILLLCFPLISFAFSLFFKIINTNKNHLQIDNMLISYNPIGFEKKHSNRLLFTALMQLILLYWIGGESIYHPQLIQFYDMYFVIIFSFFYSFGFYWLMIDIWKYSRITLKLKMQREELSKVISFLNFNKFRVISLANFIFFITLNLTNILFSIFLNIGFSYSLPGSGIEDSEPLTLPITIFIILVISPLILILSLRKVYIEVTKINFEEFPRLLNELSDETLSKVSTALKNLNSKYQHESNTE